MGHLFVVPSQGLKEEEVPHEEKCGEIHQPQLNVSIARFNTIALI